MFIPPTTPVIDAPLYHGTSVEYLDVILKEGLKPRMDRKGNWSEFPSRKDMVYLTTTYALYFANAAARGKMAILQVDPACELDASAEENTLFPDEDFIAQSVHQQSSMSLKDAHDWVLRNIEEFDHYWESSLEKMGTVGYRGVPIHPRRVAIIDPEVMERFLLLSMLDPTITPINHYIKGGFYQQFTRWVFGEAPLPHLLESQMHYDCLKESGDVRQSLVLAQNIEKLERVANDRAGIEILDL